MDDQKASLKTWWAGFTKGKGSTGGSPGVASGSVAKKGEPQARVFGVPLRVSLKYASVAISMAGDDGHQYVWGYVPVVVAKVGLYLKENATDVEGIFRIAGSQKRMKELQETFESPPRYGKSVDWSKYSVHDAASVLRRYLNHMPEPIVPLHLYNEFRNVMIKQPFDVDGAINTYRLLITSSPPASQYLLLYVLDLLAVFARKSETNLMPASNLAVIFQPGMFSHPGHLTSPDEHKIAVQVLEFLIEHQDHFVLGLSAPAPTNLNMDDLTAVSRPLKGEDLLEPSDSDEELGDVQVHEGGGARLARSVSASQQTSPTPKKKHFLAGVGRGKSGEPRAISPGAASPDTKERQKTDEAVETDLGQTFSAKVRRTKTTPSRRSVSGSAVNSGQSSRRNSTRRRGSKELSPSSSAAPSPAMKPLATLAPAASAAPVTESSQASLLGTGDGSQQDLPTPTDSTEGAGSVGGLMRGDASGEAAKAPVTEVQGQDAGSTSLPTPPSSKLLNQPTGSDSIVAGSDTS